MIGVILAGGSSSRMGRDKALIPFRGRPLISHLISALHPVFDRIVISANAEDPYAFLQLPVVPDLYPACGPLAGLHAALRYANGDSVFVTSCDTPFVSTALIRHLLRFANDASACIASVDGRLHPLIGLYNVDCLPVAESRLSTQRLKMLDFLTDVGGRPIPITPDLPFYSPHLCFNVNSEEHLRQADGFLP